MTQKISRVRSVPFANQRTRKPAGDIIVSNYRGIARRIRRGLTLIEIMIALTMTLIVLGAMMTAFQYASEQMQYGRAMMELANRARTAESLMRSDLANLTLDPRPYTQTSAPNGFFEYVEGPRRDDADAVVNNVRNYLGDVDDALGATVRSAGRPFRGRNGGQIIESSLAEVWWFTTFDDLNADYIVDFDDSVRLHRRVLLIRPNLGTVQSGVSLVVANTYLANNDISCRVVTANAAATLFDVVANNLTDLSVRKNRFCHIPDPFDTTIANNFPNQLSRPFLQTRSPGLGEDILLTDVAGFDLRVYSPDASVKPDSSIIVEPGDPGFVSSTSTRAGLGSFVDLAWQKDPTNDFGWFMGTAEPASKCNYAFVFADGTVSTTLFENVYDTWTPLYESDGIDQDLDTLFDEGTDGIDNDSANGVDDTGERETLPPYAHPIRGMQASIRLVEKGTKQVHQTTIIHSFVPE